MIVDSSALIAVIQSEHEARDISERLARESSRMSAVNWVEAGIVVDNRSVETQRGLDELVEIADIEIVPVSAEQARIARDAHRRYGRGTGHRAKLNLGDCFAYALSVSTGEPLLFVGHDFSKTDVRAAV